MSTTVKKQITLNQVGISLAFSLLLAVSQAAAQSSAGASANPHAGMAAAPHATEAKSAKPHTTIPSVPVSGIPGMSANPHSMAGAAANPHEADSFAVGDRKDVSWTLPAGWTELAPTSMRLGNFVYQDPSGQKVEITVASLPGAAGGVPANFAMWRSQLGLPQIDNAEVVKQSEKIKVGDLQMDMIDVVSSENIIDNKSKARIVGAIYVREGSTWFFKMKGEDAAVKGSKEAFLTFLKSLKFQ